MISVPPALIQPDFTVASGSVNSAITPTLIIPADPNRIFLSIIVGGITTLYACRSAADAAVQRGWPLSSSNPELRLSYRDCGPLLQSEWWISAGTAIQVNWLTSSYVPRRFNPS